MTLTYEEKFKIFQTCSGHYLCTTVPDRWMNDMVDEERNKFLVDNTIEPLANETAESLYSLIESSAMVTEEMVKEFFKNHGVTV